MCNPGIHIASFLLGINLKSVLLLELEVLLPEGVDGVNHDLDQLHLGVAETVLVGDVVGAASESAGLSPGAPGLDCELLTPGLELLNALLGVSGQVNVDGGPHASAQVGGAAVDVAVPGIKGELLAALGLHALGDGSNTPGKAGKDSLDVSTLLHGDDPGLVLLIDPEKEGLGVIVEDATALWPVTLHASNSEVAVSGHEEEVVVNQLLPHGLVHASEGVVLASKVASQLGEGAGHQLLDLDSLVLGDAGGEKLMSSALS